MTIKRLHELDIETGDDGHFFVTDRHLRFRPIIGSVEEYDEGYFVALRWSIQNYTRTNKVDVRVVCDLDHDEVAFKVSGTKAQIKRDAAIVEWCKAWLALHVLDYYEYDTARA